MADNAIAARRNPATPEAEMEELMRKHGYEGSDAGEGMKHVWDKEPSDSNAELIEHLSKKHGTPAPWGKAGKR